MLKPLMLLMLGLALSGPATGQHRSVPRPAKPVTPVRPKVWQTPRNRVVKAVKPVAVKPAAKTQQIIIAFRKNGECTLTAVGLGQFGCLGQSGVLYPKELYVSATAKERNHYSREFKVDMPFAIRIWGQKGIYIHEGRASLKTSGGQPSHGCIRLARPNAEKVYNWLQGRTKVTFTYPWTRATPVAATQPVTVPARQASAPKPTPRTEKSTGLAKIKKPVAAARQSSVSDSILKRPVAPRIAPAATPRKVVAAAGKPKAAPVVVRNRTAAPRPATSAGNRARRVRDMAWGF